LNKAYIILIHAKEKEKNLATKLQNVVYILAAMITVAIIKSLAPASVYQPQGIILPTTPSSSLTKLAKVNVYTGVAPGTSYQTLALVNVQSYYGTPSEEKELEVIHYGQQLAATVGARDLIIMQMWGNPNTKTYILNAKAIK
jgi:hypothetical protein